MTEPSRHLAAGDPAPRLTLASSSGDQVSLGTGPAIVYFYPKAFTPGCTTEACDFRDNLASLQGAGWTVLGVSPDDPKTLADFAAEHSLSYPLLSDPDGEATRAYGAFGDKTLPDGREVTGVIRSTFVVDPEGTLADVEYDVAAQGHVRALRERLRS